MKFELDLNKLSQGILVITTDGEQPKVEVKETAPKQDTTPVAEQPKEVAKEAKVINSLPNFASASRIRQEFINLGMRYNNGALTNALVKAKFIKPIGSSRRFAPGPKWNESMGVVEEMTYSKGGKNGERYIMAYNVKHPIIRNVLNNIWFHSTKKKIK